MDDQLDASRHEAQLAARLLADGPSALAALDADLRFLWVNDRLVALAGRVAAELVGRSVAEIGMGTTWARRLVGLLRRCTDGSTVVSEELRLEPDGGKTVHRCWLATAFPLAANGRARVGLQLLEIADRFAGPSKTSLERSLVAAALHELPFPIVVISAPAGVVLRTNAHLEALVGRDLGGKRLIDVFEGRLRHPDGSLLVDAEFPPTRAVELGERIHDEEVLCREGASERFRRLRVTALPILASTGRIVAAVAAFRDITDEQRARDELRDRADRMSQLVEDVKDHAIYVLDREGVIRSWNVGAEHVTGYGRDEVIGRPHVIFYPEEDVLLGRPEQALRIAVVRGRHQQIGWRRRRDGGRFWAEVMITALRDGRGELTGFAKFVHDRTESRLIEEALGQSNRRVASILESVPDAFCAVDREGRFTYLNSAAEQLLRRTRAELLGVPFDQGLAEAGAIGLEQALATAMAQRIKVELESYVERLDVWLELRINPHEHGLSICFRDVTRRKQWEQAQQLLVTSGRLLAESLDIDETLTQVTHLVVPQLGDWCFIVAVDEEDRVERVSVAHVDPVERQRGLELLRRFPPRGGKEPGLSRTLRTGTTEVLPHLTDDFLRRIARGPEHLAELRSLGLVSFLSVPLRCRGRTRGAMGFASTTPGHHYSAADVPLAEELGRRAALAVDNSRLYGEARAAIHAREDLISIASHDLKAPLAALKLRLQMVGRSVEDPSKLPALHLGDQLRALESQVDRMVKLVDSFLQGARVAAGFLELRLEALDAAALVCDVVTRFHDQLQEAECAVALDAPGLVVGRWDPVRLEQVVTNLVSNAIKFGRGQPIVVSVSAVAGKLRLEVSDRGPGIAAAEQEQIFERFRRVAGEASGFGLGLWIARRIVEAHGGTIRVDSHLGAGARFTVEIPLAPPGPTPPA